MAISSNSEKWAGHTKEEVEAHIKARFNEKLDTSALSNIKPFGFAQGVLYNPATDSYPTYVEMLNRDGTSAIFSGPTRTLVDNSHYLISMKLKTFVIQKRSTNNAFYPIAIAGQQFSNMTDGYPYPICYNSTLTVNPSTGAVKAAKFVNSSNNYEAVVSNISNFQIKVVTSQNQVGSESNILYVVVS